MKPWVNFYIIGKSYRKKIIKISEQNVEEERTSK